MYKPLSDFVTIKASGIDGLGLFAKKFIPKETNLGASHLKINCVFVRTPLGGFINNSDKPNCIKNKIITKDLILNDEIAKVYHKALDHPLLNSYLGGIRFDYSKYELITLKDIEENTELTVKYTFYNIMEI